MKTNVPGEDEWRDEAPKLSFLKDKLKTDAPEGYFDSLPGKIMEKIKAEEASTPIQKNKKGRIIFFRPGFIAAAISAAAMLVLALNFFSKEQTTQPAKNLQAEMNKISTEEMLAWLDTQDVEDEEIVHVFGEALPAAMIKKTVIPKEQVSDKEIIDFLDDAPLDDLDLGDLLD